MSTRQAVPRSPHFQTWLPLLALLLLLSACRPTLPAATSDPGFQAATQTPDSSASTMPTSTPRPSSAAPTATPDCLIAGGTLTGVHFYSPQLENDFFFQIYLPPCYNPNADERYPVVYLLHGLSYTSDQWPRLELVNTMDTLIAQRDLPPFIVVMPLEAVFTPPQTSAFGDALIADLIPFVDGHFNTLDEKAFRAIGGVSRGAAWAVHIGFENAGVFAKVGAHSLPLFEADGGRLIGWVTQSSTEDLPQFFIDIGRDDQEWATAKAFADLLDEHNIPHEWYLFNNDHTEAYWSSHLTQYLKWYAQDW